MEYVPTTVGTVTTTNTAAGLTTMAIPLPVSSAAGTALPVNGVWYNYLPENVGQILTAAPAVQVELGDGDNIARQFNQQVQAQYGNLQVQVLQHSVFPTKDDPDTITADIIPTKSNSNPKTKRGGPNERIPCELCGKTVSCNATLKDHMRTHTGERPFKCSECGLAFAQRSNLRMHKRLHTGERPYMCGICGKTFARSSHLPAHMRTHTGEKPFVCIQCNHAFITSQQLKNHFRVHTGEKPWKCDLCPAAFTHSSSLSTHKKKHSGQKPYTCETCNKSFFFSSALVKHTKVHSKERPFLCVTCDKSFKYKESLTVHMDKFCGKEISKRPRAKRKPDARKPGPKPGSGRKYIQKRKARPRRRPKKRGRWSKRQVVRRNYKDMEDGADINFEELDKINPQHSVNEHGDPIMPQDNKEPIPVAELKVEVLNHGNGMVELQQDPLSAIQTDMSQHIKSDSHIIANQNAHEIRIEDNASLTIVSADDADVANMAGVQVLTLPSDMPFQLVQANGEHISAQLRTIDGVQMWCPTRQY